MHLVNIDRDKLVIAAGGDPWQANASLQHGRPAQVDRLAQAFRSAERSTEAAENAISQAWERFGRAREADTFEHSINASVQVRLVANSLSLQASQLPAVAVDLEAVAAALTEAQQTSTSCISMLEEQLARSDEDLGNLIGQESGRHVADLQRSLISVEIQAIEQAKAALRQLVHIRDGYIGRLRDAEGNLRRTENFPEVITTAEAARFCEADASALRIPSPGTSPELVNEWWNALSSNQQANLTSRHSSELGNLDGIPVSVRDEINQEVLKGDLNRVRELAEENCVSVDDVLADPRRFGLSAAEVCRYTNADRTQQGLTACGRAEDEHGRNPRLYLLKYLPEACGGDGAAAIAMGNPDIAANTAVLVKGMGSGVRQGTLANPDGRQLYHEANCADWGKDTAVVMWVGYDAPDGPMDANLYEPELARQGGQSLAADVNAFAATHQGAPTHVTVVGHSYGSTTVADAAAEWGMHAHDVALVGCPGTDLARSSADFHLPPGGHLFVGDASQDEVSWFGHDTVKTPFGGVGLGPDPAVDGYGSTRFKAEVVGYSANPFYDHSHYFDDGSESLFNLGEIVSGHGDALQPDHMTARHRGEYRMPSVVDPEAARGPTTGHRHAAPPR